jgi:hypothetical protein
MTTEFPRLEEFDLVLPSGNIRVGRDSLGDVWVILRPLVDQIIIRYPTGYRVAERLVIPYNKNTPFPIRDAEYHSLIAEHLPKFYTDSNRTGSWRLQTCLSINNLPAFLHALKPDAKTQKCYHARLTLLKAYRRELRASKAPKVVKPTKPINPDGPPLPLNGHWLRSERRRLHRSSSKICHALGVKESVLLAIEENGTMLPRSWLLKLSKLSFRVTWKPQD